MKNEILGASRAAPPHPRVAGLMVAARCLTTLTRTRIRRVAAAAGGSSCVLAAAGYFSPLRRPRDARGLNSSSAVDAAVAAGGDDDGRVRTIHRYPVKSCGGEQLDEVRCDRLQPLPGDRAFMWVDAESKFITQRPHEPRQGRHQFHD